MKPVFVSDSLGCLYQSGYRQLSKMDEPRRGFLRNEVRLAIAVSPHVIPWFEMTVHEPFGDNKQWAGPNVGLADAIRSAARLLETGDHVMAYCFYGRNRSGLVNALILRELLSCPGAQALATLRRARKGAAGGNPHFIRYLEGLPAP